VALTTFPIVPFFIQAKTRQGRQSQSLPPIGLEDYGGKAPGFLGIKDPASGLQAMLEWIFLCLGDQTYAPAYFLLKIVPISAQHIR
jgi:hypothetical protein